MSGHTEGKWEVFPGGTAYYRVEIRADGKAVVLFHTWDVNAEANAKRIVACINACSDVKTSELEGGSLTLGSNFLYTLTPSSPNSQRNNHDHR